MSDVSLSSVLSFLDADEVATVRRQVHAERGDRTKRSERDGRTFLFVAAEGEERPSEVVWVDVEGTFDEETVEVFADRCESQGLDGTLLTTGDEAQARETLAFAFASDDQLELPEDEDEDPRLLVSPEEVTTPISLETLDDFVEDVEAADLDEDVIDEYHEPHQPEFEEVLDEIDAEEAAAEAETQASGSGLGLVLVVVLVAVLLAGVAFYALF
ncbi:hypothetical protein [Haloferax sp. YSMS24]|uniref:hypothetical protein n=1 Tax=Haloferax sp. YSMS24 TaxID=3388425 RepID=UPI00398D3D92